MQTADTTIIIPTRTIDFLLKECIMKIRELYETVKIVLIVDEFQENETFGFDKNVQFIKSENRNMSAKRNLGVKNADTAFVAFIDSDAYPAENWIETGTEFLSNNPDYVAVTGNQLIPQDDDFEKQCLRLVRFCPLFTYSKWSKIIDLNASEQDCTEFVTSNLIMKTSDYLKIGGMDENIYLAEDNEFSKRLHNKGYKIRFLPKMRVYHHEAAYFPFMKKIFSMSFYYTIKNKQNLSAKDINEKIRMFIPLIGTVFMFLLLLLTFIFRLNLFINLLLPLLIFVIFSVEAIRLGKNFSAKRTKSYFMFLWLFVSFCVFYLLGQISGILHIKGIRAENLYRHY